jgi:hypothetical protein
MTWRLDYGWELQRVMASGGMFQTTDLIGAAGRAAGLAVVQPGLPAGHPSGRSG